eukprot:1275576-Pleurochrysis_carterae.AAC.1
MRLYASAALLATARSAGTRANQHALARAPRKMDCSRSTAMRPRRQRSAHNVARARSLSTAAILRRRRSSSVARAQV